MTLVKCLTFILMETFLSFSFHNNFFFDVSLHISQPQLLMQNLWGKRNEKQKKYVHHQTDVRHFTNDKIQKE